jgi:hypothetical protein
MNGWSGDPFARQVGAGYLAYPLRPVCRGMKVVFTIVRTDYDVPVGVERYQAR